MFKRISNVSYIHVNVAVSGSVVQIGDSKEIYGDAKALAVVREKPRFWGQEGDFQQFPIFTTPVPFTGDLQPLLMKKQNLSSQIRVGKVCIERISGASLLHIGSNEHANVESRLKYIRHIIKEKK